MINIKINKDAFSSMKDAIDATVSDLGLEKSLNISFIRALMAAMYITEKPLYELPETMLSQLYGVSLAAPNDEILLYFAAAMGEAYNAGILMKGSKLVCEVFKEAKVR